MPPRRNASRAASAAKPHTPTKAEAAPAPASKAPKTTTTTKRKAATKKEEVEPAEAANGNGDPAVDEKETSPPAARKAKKPRVSKAAAASSSQDDASSSSPAAPKGKDDDILAYEGCPKTMDIPNPLQLDNTPRPEGVVRVAAWNIVSLKSAEGKGMTRYIEAEDPDILVLTETKVNDIPTFFQSTRYPHQSWGIGATKGYAGVAVLSKVAPIAVHKGLPNMVPSDYDTKSRCLIVEYPGCFLVATYCVNAGEGLKSMSTKEGWNKALAERMAELDKSKPVIWTGDYNVVYDSYDLARASQKWNKSAGYTQIECDAHRALLEGRATEEGKPLVDVWREKHPGAKGHFTYYGWRGQCRSKGIGWRIDSFVVSERVKEACRGCEIRQVVYGASDHVPVYADFDASLFHDEKA